MAWCLGRRVSAPYFRVTLHSFSMIWWFFWVLMSAMCQVYVSLPASPPCSVLLSPRLFHTFADISLRCLPDTSGFASSEWKLWSIHLSRGYLEAPNHCFTRHFLAHLQSSKCSPSSRNDVLQVGQWIDGVAPPHRFHDPQQPLHPQRCSYSQWFTSCGTALLRIQVVATGGYRLMCGSVWAACDLLC